MSAEDRARYARQISLAEIGVGGQARIAEARYALPAEPRVARWADAYARRAGARHDAAALPVSTADAAEVTRIAAHPRLEDAAAYLLGALGALELVRRATLSGELRPIAPITLGEPE